MRKRTERSTGTSPGCAGRRWSASTASTVGRITPRTRRSGWVDGRYCCWIERSALAEAVLQAMMTRNRETAPSLKLLPLMVTSSVVPCVAEDGVAESTDGFCAAARALGQSVDKALGGFYRRLRGRLGGLAANVALARKLALLFYRLLRYGMDYVEKGLKSYEAKVLATETRLLRKLAKKQGFALIPSTAS